MKFGSRQICNVVFRAAQSTQIGKAKFNKGQPVFYLDTAKTSTLEGAATTVYATGGRGNTRLIAWEGEKTLTFTVEDALLSPISFAMLSGAGVVKGNETDEVHFHQTTMAAVDAITGIIDLTNALEPDERIDDTAPLFIMKVDNAGDLTGDLVTGDFSIVKSSDDDVNGKQLTFSNNANLAEDYSKFNGNQPAAYFPYILNSKHEATTAEINTWVAHKDDEVASPNTSNGAVDGTTASGAVLSQHIPASSKAVNGEETITIVQTKDGDYIIDLGVWQVINSDTNSYVTLSMPKDLRQPVFTGVELNTIYNLTSGQEGAFNTAKKYRVTDSYKGSTAHANWTTTGENEGFKKEFYSRARYYSSTATSSVQWQVTFTELNGANLTQTTITKDLTKTFRDYIIERYFGIGASFETTRELYDASFLKAITLYTAIAAEDDIKATGTVMVDYYVVKKGASVTELQIDAETFGGYYYVEADTLFRRQSDGKDLPANITLPNVKIQSNFTFSMAATGDPSTFTFTMDAFPGYTYFDKTRKVLCAIQIVDDRTDKSKSRKSVFTHKAQGDIEASMNDSSPNVYNEQIHSSWGTGN